MIERKAPPRILLGSPKGHCGKTILSCGIAKILKEKGYKVQTFKKGPDYIDPSWLSAASGKPCRNLDLYLMGSKLLVEHFFSHTNESDIALIEGNMGLYDGIEEDGSGSSAHISRLLKSPVILLISAEKMARSVAALLEGYRNFEPDTMIWAVILNHVSGERHAQKLLHAIERHVKIPVVGVVPKDKALLVNERHLGLVPYKEEGSNLDVLEKIASFVERHIDIKGILEIANKAPEFLLNEERKERSFKPASVKIGVFYDRVFNFYYPENLEALTYEGADLIFIDSISQRKLPDIDGLYIGGGFPEFYLQELSSNRELIDDVVRFVECGKPVYAECGGLMYLCDHIFFEGKRFKMAGLIPADVFLTKKPQGHGYVEALVTEENPFYAPGEKLRGHEFHHSALKLKGRISFVLKMNRGKGGYGLNDGVLYKNMFASYMHIHVLGVPHWARRFVELSLELKRKNECSYIKKGVRYG